MKYLLFILCSFIIIAGCKKEPDPCEAIRNEPGGFKIEELFFTDKGIEAQDTVSGLKSIRFTSHRNYDTYTWWVGSESEPRTGKSLNLIFPAGINIDVMLIGQRQPQACIPGDDGIDTFIRRLITVPIDSSAVIGRWQGYLTTNPSDTFTITIGKINAPNLSCRNDYSLLNLPKNSTPAEQPTYYCMPRVLIGFNGFMYDYHGFDGDPIPWSRKNILGKISPIKNQIIIEFEAKPQNGEWRNLKFIGTRIN